MYNGVVSVTVLPVCKHLWQHSRTALLIHRCQAALLPVVQPNSVCGPHKATAACRQASCLRLEQRSTGCCKQQYLSHAAASSQALHSPLKHASWCSAVNWYALFSRQRQQQASMHAAAH